MNAWAQGRGPAGPGLHLLARGRGGRRRARSPATLGPSAPRRFARQLGLKVGDAAFFAAGDPRAFYRFAGAARTKVGTDLRLIDEAQFKFCWIVDFPMYEFNEEERRIDFSHNPFSMPQGEMEAFKANDPLEIARLAVRHRLQRRRAVVGRGPEPPAGHHDQGF